MSAGWFRLANRYPNTRGPTVPFLLGALRLPPGAVTDPDTSQAELRALLAAMRDDTPDGHQVTIGTCRVIGQLVVAVEFSHPAPTNVVRIDSPSKPKQALYCEQIYGADVRDLESLAAELWRLHGDVISKGHFSFHHAAWHPFCQEERERIRQALIPREGENVNAAGSS